ncbi:hypothetical protein SAZ10_25885 [Mesorhizobium sp. BAC0120]|uniref:hypothetical protein n=1 Tax=Mesorhizobium sp. BAC0120 TaxID=3090670 RepID=UPI00298CF20C|nr:hypothetical protein [Mesorhizobium sp. BAC0120]MDW6025195.1 hypothetical protein [Mesorhizobium sp. BAC0120]
MPPTGIADSEQLRMLTAVLDDYCHEHGILDASEEWDVASKRVYTLFENGVRTPSELKNALAILRRGASRRLGSA